MKTSSEWAAQNFFAPVFEAEPLKQNRTRAEKGRLKRKNPLENQRVAIKMAEWKGFEPLIQVYARILA